MFQNLRRFVFAAFVAILAFGPVDQAPARDVVRLPVPYMQQPDGSTCLPTSLLMAMHFLGRADLTSETVFQLHKTCRYDRYNVPAIVREYDLYAFPSWLEFAWTRETVEAELRAGRPVIFGLDCSRAGHFVLAVGYTDDGKVIIHDPYWKEPGWQFGGPFVTTDWDPLIWRNGIMVRPEPFPESPRVVSGTVAGTTAPRTLTRGEIAYAEFAVKNNGREPWPDEIYLAAVDAYSSPTSERISSFAILPGTPGSENGAWISGSKAAIPDKKNLAPGEVAYFKVPLRAPADFPDQNSVVFRENFNLIDGEGRWFSEHWQTGPSNRQIFFRVAVVSADSEEYKLPLIETAERGKPQLPWKIKNGAPGSILAAVSAPPFPEVTSLPAAEDASTTQPYAPLVPPSPGTAMSLVPPADEEYEVAYVGDPRGRDYRVEAWIYCDYRPEEKPRGYDRAGIFIRDSGHHRITHKTELENGECIYMAYDTDNGKVHMAEFQTGGHAALTRGRQETFIKGSGWHKFAIEAQGNMVRFELDNKEITTASLERRGRRGRSNVTHAEGDCGVFIRSVYPTPEERNRGMKFAGFRVDPLVSVSNPESERGLAESESLPGGN